MRAGEKAAIGIKIDVFGIVAGPNFMGDGDVIVPILQNIGNTVDIDVRIVPGISNILAIGMPGDRFDFFAGVIKHFQQLAASPIPQINVAAGGSALSDSDHMFAVRRKHAAGENGKIVGFECLNQRPITGVINFDSAMPDGQQIAIVLDRKSVV